MDEFKELLKRTNGDAPTALLVYISMYSGMRIKGLKSTINVDYMKPLDLLLPSRVARVIQGEAMILSELLLIWTR
jgi:hypothetical protein